MTRGRKRGEDSPSAATVGGVVRLEIGGEKGWAKLEGAFENQMLDVGVDVEGMERMSAVLRSAYLKWLPGRVVLVDEADHDGLRLAEAISATYRQITNGLLFEVLRREIALERQRRKEAA